jgi:autotransporter-associated beta strand protein
MAVLTIDGGTINANRARYVTDYGFQVGAAPGGVAVMRLNSGTITTTSEIWLGESSTQSTYAAFTQTGGVVNPRSYFVVGHRGDDAVYNLRGGTLTTGGNSAFTIGAGTLQLGGVAGNSHGVVNVSGGVLVSQDMYVGEYGHGVLNVSNGGSVIVKYLSMGRGSGTTATSMGIVNIQAGGRLNAGLVINAASEKGLINWHGGILQGNLATTSYVWPEGIVTDDGGTSTTVSGLQVPTGNGVSAIEVSGGRGYLEVPVVHISRGAGDTTGVGASASTLIDAQGNLVGITITNPGMNYTVPPVVTLGGGGGSGALVGTVVLAPNGTSGGLKKVGSGTLSLGTVNYLGPTEVMEGNLRVNGTLSSSSVVNVHGGAELGGTGVVAVPVVLAAGNIPGEQGAISLADGQSSTLTLTGAVSGGGLGSQVSRLIFEIATHKGGDRLVLGTGSTFSMSGGGGLITLLPGGNYLPTTWTLMTFPSGTAPNVQLDAGSQRLGPNAVTMNMTETSLSVNIAGVPVPAAAYWTGAYGSSWAACGEGTDWRETNFISEPAGSNTQQWPGMITSVYFMPLAAGGLNTVLGKDFWIDGLVVQAGTPAVSIGGNNTLRIGAKGLTVEAGASGLTISAAVALDNAQSWVNAGDIPVLVSGSITMSSLTTTGNFLFSKAPVPGGKLTILGGTTQIGTGGSLDGINFSQVKITGALVINLSNTSDSSTVMTGSGDLVKRGTGTLTLRGNSTFSGFTTILEGSLQLGTGIAAGVLGPGAIVNHARLAFYRNGAASFDNGIAGTGEVSQLGTGTVTLNGAIDYSGNTSIAGWLVIAGPNSHSIGTVSGAGTLQVPAGSALVSDGVRSAGWEVQGTHIVRADGGATGASRLSSLTLGGLPGAWTGKLDVDDNAVIVTGGTVSKAALISLLQDQIASGKAGGAWNGTGITSSTVGASGGESTLALVDNADLGLTSFRGQGVGADSLIVVPAKWGDATLDSQVDAFDLNLLAGHWQQDGALWSAGDFTGDGKVDAFDLNVLAAHWQEAVRVRAMAVPEPATLGMLGAGLAELMWRRKRGEVARGGGGDRKRH